MKKTRIIYCPGCGKEHKVSRLFTGFECSCGWTAHIAIRDIVAAWGPGESPEGFWLSKKDWETRPENFEERITELFEGV